MNINKYIKRQAWGYSAMLIIGIAALFTGYILKFETQVMSGIVFGFLPVGIGGLIIMLYSRKNPKMYRNIEMEADERNVFIRNKTGATAFWITMWYVFALNLYSNIGNLTPFQFSFSTLIFMIVVYFLMLFINISKY